MDSYKTIFSGRLEFGTDRSYEQVVKLFEHRTENYYRHDVLLKTEEVFDESTRTLNVPRLIALSTEKSWRNTLNLLEYIAQYAIAGQLWAWRTAEGKMLESRMVEPKGDKAAVQAFLKGRELVKKEGMETEAKKALSRAIEKFERHALAYERRGRVNFTLKNFKDAFYDYTKSIDINPHNPQPYLGRALTRMAMGEHKQALPDLDQAIKKSIPHQPIYWQARRIKADCHLGLGEFDKVVFELKLVTKREFLPDDPNHHWRQRAFFHFGKALMGTGAHLEAVEAFNKAIAIDEERGSRSDAELLLFRGMARQKAGESDFTNDWKEAAGMGSAKAAQLLEELA